VGLLLVNKNINKNEIMSNYLKIKPIYSVAIDVYPYANAIIWACNDLYRNATSAKLNCNLVNVTVRTEMDSEGNTLIYDYISPSLLDFEMEIPYDILEVWGPDSVIDDFVLTYSPDFERE
jgi:hypothetical protein